MEKDKQKKGGVLGNLVFNILIPVLILSKLSGDNALGPAISIVVALAFPIIYGLWDLKSSGKFNVFSILGIVSVSLTGGFSLFELPAEYIAIKEAAIPALLGLAVILTQGTKYPIVKMLILNREIIRIDDLYASLSVKNFTSEFEKRLNFASYIVAGSFFLSSILNYVLAKVILVSPPGTSAFTEELGTMTALSFPVIALPSTIILMVAIWYLFSQVKKLTGVGFDRFLVGVES